jgi:hypothetical protein
MKDRFQITIQDLLDLANELDLNIQDDREALYKAALDRLETSISYEAFNKLMNQIS